MTDTTNAPYTFDYGDDPPDRRTAVFQALGSASVCWEHLEHAGVFDVSFCTEIGDALMAELARLDESAATQIDHLAEVIMHEIPGEPSRSEGAVETAIRLLRDGGVQANLGCATTDQLIEELAARFETDRIAAGEIGVPITAREQLVNDLRRSVARAGIGGYRTVDS
jgi:hypothetical protein